MPKPKNTFTFTSASGKVREIDEEIVNSHGMSAYAKANPGATIRMRDDNNDDYNIPLEFYDYALRDGLHPFRIAHTSPKSEEKPAQEPSAPSPESTMQAEPQETQPEPVQPQSSFKKDWRTDIAANMAVANANSFNSYMNERQSNLGKAIKERTEQPIDTSVNLGFAEKTAGSSGGQDPLSVDGQLSNAYKDRERINQALKKREEELKRADAENTGFFARLVREAAQGTRAGMDPNLLSGDDDRLNTDDQYLSLMAAARKNQEQIYALENEKSGKNNNFWRSFGQEFGKGYLLSPINSYRDSYALINAAGQLPRIQKKIESGEALTEEEKSAAELVNQYSNNEVAQNLYASKEGAWSRAGKTAAGAVDFMVSLALTPGWMSVANVTKDVITKVGGKYLAKSASDALAKSVAKAVGRGLVKMTGITAGSLAAGAYSTNMPTGASKVAKSTAENYYSNGLEDLGSAFAEAERSWIGENATEALGSFLPGGGVILKGFEKLGLSKISNFMRGLGSKKFVQQYNRVLEATGLNSVPGEAMEEYANFLYDAMTGHSEEAIKAVKDPKTHIDIWLGCLTTGVLLRSVPMVAEGYHTGQHLYYKHQLESANKNAVNIFDSSDLDWEEIRDKLDDTENGDMSSVVSGIIRGEGMSREAMNAVIDYAGSLMKFRAHNILEIENANDAANLTPESVAVNNGIASGHELEGEERAVVQDDYLLAKQEAEEIFGSEVVSMIDEDPIGAAQSLRNSLDWSEAEERCLMNYLEKKSMVTGMDIRIEEEVSSRVSEAESVINKQTNVEDGMVHPAKNANDGSKLYIVSGKVATNEDGTVNREASDDTIVVVDENGKKSMVPASSLSEIEQPIPADQLKEESAANIRKEYEQKERDQINGVVTPQPGMVISLQGDDGTYNVSVVGEDGQGNVVVDMGGQQFPIPYDTFQEAAKTAKLSERKAYLQEQSNVPAEQAETEVSPEAQEEVQATEAEAIPADETVEQPTEVEQPQTAIDMIPKEELRDSRGKTKIVRNFEAVDPETTYNALLEVYGDEGRVQKKVSNRINKIDSEIKAVQRKLDRLDDTDDFDSDIDNAEGYRSLQSELEGLKSKLSYWQNVQLVPSSIKAKESQALRDQESQAKKEKEAEASRQAEQDRIEREKVNGVPDILNDTPADARSRGYRNVNGRVVERQDQVPFIKGRESSVKFSKDNTLSGNIAVMEADQLQPSHINGQRNNVFFIDEAQPKDRADNVSSMTAAQIARDINPEEITGDGSAYQFSAPSVNVRGEVIQGNNRSEAVKVMYSSESYKESQDAYKKYLMDNAEKFGLDREAIAKMDKPVMVNVLPVSDEQAISLGQQTASDIESGGIERIDPVTTSRKLKDKMTNYAQILLQSDEDMSLSEAVVNNGSTAIQWLHNNGFISDTQFSSAFKNGEITPEAKMDLVNLLKQSLFEGGVTELPKMFDMLPAKAQKAVLSTFMRDFNSKESDRILPEIREAIEAFYEASVYSEAFANAKNYEEAIKGMEQFTNQYMNINGESVLPTERYSPMAFLLASRMKGLTMREQSESFNKFFDLVQGTYQKGLFDSEEMPSSLDKEEAERIAFGQPVQNGRQSTEGSLNEKVKEAEADTNQNPTEAQIEAGNYKKGHVTIGDFDITIENPAGSTRSGKDANGKKWSVTMANTYGYIRGTEGVDGDHIDVFLSNDMDGWNGGKVFVVDQTNTDGSFDEHKCMLGFNSLEEAEAAYYANYSTDWKKAHPGIRITGIPVDDFSKWIQSSHRKTKPFAEYSAIKQAERKEGASIEESDNSQKKRISIKKKYNNENAGLERSQFTDQLEEAEAIDKMAKLLGVKVKFTDETGPGDAYISGDTVYIKKGNYSGEKTLKFLVGHEFTHRMQDVSPEAYEHFKAFAKDFMGDEWEAARIATKDAYDRYNEYARENGLPEITLSEDEIDDEVTADFAGRLADEQDVFNNFVHKLESEKEGKSIMQKIRDFFNRIKDFFTGKAKRNIDNAIAQLESLISQSAKEIAENRELINEDERVFNDTPKSEEDVTDIRYSFKKFDDMFGQVQDYFNRHYLGQGELTKTDKSRAPLRKNINQNDINEAYKVMSDFKDFISPYIDLEHDGKRYLPAEVYGKSTIFTDSAYGKTMENMLICIRTLAYLDFVNEVKRKLGRPITVRESFLASQMLYDIAVDPQCLYCYVSLDRKAYDEYLLKYIDQRDKTIEAIKAGDKSREQIYKEFIGKRKDTPNMQKRFASWELIAKNGNSLTSDAFALPTKRSEIRNSSVPEAWKIANDKAMKLKGKARTAYKNTQEYNRALIEYMSSPAGQIDDAEAYAQSASWAKKLEEYRSYTGELLKQTRKSLRKIMDQYGLRFYSFSEFSPAFILENMQMVLDASLRGLTGFAYTKETDFIRIFAPSGLNINCSCYGRLNEKGEVEMDESQGANWEEVKQLRQQYPNVGSVFVATNDKIIEWALNQDWIDVIIPFHIVRTGSEVAEFYNYTNYTDASTDKTSDNKSVTIHPNEHHNDKETFLNICKERGIKPRFYNLKLSDGSSVLDHPNYMRLVNETRRSVEETPLLKPVFNLEEAKKSFSNFIEKGGYYDNYFQSEEAFKEGVNQVVEDIKLGKSGNEVEYGRQDIPMDAARLMQARSKKQFRHHNKSIVVNTKENKPSLVGVHNISEGKLRSALKMGGLANPSLAVIDSENQSHEGYGEISLIAPSSLIDKRTGKNAGTYTGDAWTPTYPQVISKFTGKGESISKEDVKKLPEPMQEYTGQAMDRFINNGEGNGLAYMYLSEKGMAPDVVMQKVESSESLMDKIESLGKSDPSNMSDEELESLFDLYIDEQYNGDREKYERFTAIRKASLEKKLEEFSPKSLFYKSAKKELEDIEKYGFSRSKLSSFASKVRADISRRGQADAQSTSLESQKYISENGLESDFEKWQEDLKDRYNVKEYLHNGYTKDGTSKYIPHTLENVSKYMNKEGKVNTKNDTNYSATRSLMLQRLNTLDQIRKNKGKLGTPSDEDIEQIKSEYSNLITELSEEKKLSDNVFMNMDEAALRLQESVQHKDPIAFLNEEYGYEISKGSELEKNINKVLGDLKNLPSKYFETKFNRPVSFNEFSAAVVPDNIDPNLIGALKSNGIEVYSYKAGDNESRKDAFNQATQSSDDILFRKNKKSKKRRKNKRETSKGQDELSDELQKNKEIEQAAQTLAESLGIEVNVIHDINEVTHSNPRNQEELRKAKGWYSTKTGEVNVVIPNAESVEDVQETILHEVVGHKGMREVVGEDNFNDFLDNVFFNADPKTRSEIIDRIMRNGWDARLATEEYIAELSESGFKEREKHNFFQKIGDAFMDLLSKAKIYLNYRINDNDLRYMLWRSYKLRMSKGKEDVFSKAEDIAMQNELGVGNFRARNVFGGNSGYVGYSMSKRAYYAKEEGRYPKTEFRKVYNVTPKSLDLLVESGMIDDSEWHHTSSYGNRTTFYGWEDELYPIVYLSHKKEIDNLSREFSKPEPPFVMYGPSISSYINRHISDYASLTPEEEQAKNKEHESVSNSGMERYQRIEAHKEIDRKYDSIIGERIENNNAREKVLETPEYKEYEEKIRKEEQEYQEWNTKRKQILERIDEIFSDESIENDPAVIEYKKSISTEEDESDSIRYRVIQDADKIKELESEPKVKAYRTMQVIDGELYSPMAKKVAGKENKPIKFRWEAADEYPELAIKGDGSDRYPNVNGYYITIDKGQGKGSLDVAYNPYNHTSRTVLNDQFSSAYIRPNLVVVEVEIPQSELEGKYKAEKAKDPVGEMKWHSGSVSAKFAELGNPRKVILTRYDKPVRILTKKEEAEKIAESLKGTGISMPYNLVTPQVREELQRLGIQIDNSKSGSVAKNPSYGKAEYITDEQINEMNNRMQANSVNAPESIRSEAEEISEEFNTPVRFISDKETSEGNTKGWYDSEKGEMVVNLPNIIDVEDVRSTILQALSVKELKELVGESGYDNFLGELLSHSKSAISNKVNAISEGKGIDTNNAMEEYIREVSEKGYNDPSDSNSPVWTKLKESTIKKLDKFLETGILPKSIKLGENEIRYILWKGHHNSNEDISGLRFRNVSVNPEVRRSEVEESREEMIKSHYGSISETDRDFIDGKIKEQIAAYKRYDFTTARLCSTEIAGKCKSLSDVFAIMDYSSYKFDVWDPGTYKAYLRIHPEQDYATRISNEEEDSLSDLQEMVDRLDLYECQIISRFIRLCYNPSEKKTLRKGLNQITKKVDEQKENLSRSNGLGENLNLKKSDITYEEYTSLFTQLNSDPYLNELFEKVMDVAKNLGLKFHLRKFGKTTFGDNFGNIVRLNLNLFNSAKYSNDTKAQTMLHELIHSVTSYAFDIDRNSEYGGGIQLSEAMREAVQQIKLAFNQIKYDKNFKGEYGIKNIHEMMAELSNPSFRQKLQETTIWERIVDAFKKLFGIKRNDMLSGLETSLSYMLENFDQTAYTGYINVLQGLKGYATYSKREVNTLAEGGSFFSGGGLLEEGLKQVLDPKFAVEYDKKISGVYRNNFGDHIVTADVRDVDPMELLENVSGKVQYFHASPVCKNFSTAKADSGELPLDISTAISTAEAIRKMTPEIVTIENVPRYRNSESMKIITDQLDRLGYNYDIDVYDSADYGAYTSRRRMILRAVRSGDLPQKPEIQERTGGWIDVVGDLIDDLKETTLPPWMERRLSEIGIERYNIKKPLYIFNGGTSTGKLRIAYSDQILPTITTMGGDRIIMPDGRVLAVSGRVLARISGIDDDYILPTSDNLSHKIIGNGIPVKLTKAVIAPLIQSHIQKSDAEELNTSDIRFRTSKKEDVSEDTGTDLSGITPDMAKEAVDEVAQEPKTVSQHLTDALVQLSNSHKNNLQVKKDALAEITASVYGIRKAKSAQKAYDKSTVKDLATLATTLIRGGFFDKPSAYEISRIIAAIKNGSTLDNIQKQAEKILDIIISNQLSASSELLQKLSKVKSKVNASGVEVQGKIDARSKKILDVFRNSLFNNKNTVTPENIKEMIADAEERMSSEDSVVSENAAIEWEGLNLANRYMETIRESMAEETELRAELAKAAEDKSNGTMTPESYKEFVESTKEAIRSNQLERIDAYSNLIGDLISINQTGRESAKDFIKEEKERVSEIHHNANSDMEGIPNRMYRREEQTWKQKFANNPILRFLFAPLATFDQMLRMFGSKSVNGEGYLFNRYMPQCIYATGNEYDGMQEAFEILDNKVSELFGKKMKWSDLYVYEKKVENPIIHLRIGGKEPVDCELSQGNALYIYMANKMEDGVMKLRKMGITQKDVDNLTSLIDPRFIELADWLQEYFMPMLRNKYNEVYKRMYGIPMADIENYYPLRILSSARQEDVDISENTDGNNMPSTITSSVIKRRRNSTALDILNTDAFSLVVEHIQEMEHWNAFAEFNRDINTLLSYRHFKNQVLNMTSIYGSGRTLWDTFFTVSQIVAGQYRPAGKKGTIDSFVVNIGKNVTAAKITFRIYTAIKQLLSLPSFAVDASAAKLAKNLSSPIEAWNWSMENLPIFRKRWMGRQAGDSRLMSTDLDWNFIPETFTRIGMTPNAFVDAMAVSIGAKSIYDTKYEKYLRYGYSEEQADRKAKMDATIIFNETQQSNESMFLAPIQLDRTTSSVALTVFRNSSFGYQRQLVDAIRTIYRMTTEKDYHSKSIEFMTKQNIRSGLSEQNALYAAKKEYNRALFHNMAKMAMFGFILQFAWNIGSYLPYMLFGDDDDKKKEMMKDAAIHGMFGSTEGLSGGSIISESLNMLAQDKDFKDYDPTLLPAISDTKRLVQTFGTDYVEGVNGIINLLVQGFVGVNPQSITETAISIYDACGGDIQTTKEATIFAMRVLNVPQSQIDQVYVDEINLSAREAQKYTISELASRYAKYRLMRGSTNTMWMYDEEGKDAALERHKKRFERNAKERILSGGDAAVNESFNQYLDEYVENRKHYTNIQNYRYSDTDKYAQKLEEFMNTPEGKRYAIMMRATGILNHLAGIILDTKDPEVINTVEEKIAEAKKEFVSALESTE